MLVMVVSPFPTVFSLLFFLFAGISKYRFSFLGIPFFLLFFYPVVVTEGQFFPFPFFCFV